MIGHGDDSREAIGEMGLCLCNKLWWRDGMNTDRLVNAKACAPLNKGRKRNLDGDAIGKLMLTLVTIATMATAAAALNRMTGFRDGVKSYRCELGLSCSRQFIS